MTRPPRIAKSFGDTPVPNNEEIQQILRYLKEGTPEMSENCPRCGLPKRRTCDGDGWLEAIGPCGDGSYITSRPCPNDR